MRNFSIYRLEFLLVWLWQGAGVESSSTVYQEMRVSNFSTKTTSATSTKADCECVPFYQCENGTFNVHGTQLITYKKVLPKLESTVNNLLQGRCPPMQLWCCNETREAVYQTVHEEQTSGSSHVETTEGSSKQKEGCGYRMKTLAFEYKILGKSNEAEVNEFPWMVMLLTRDDKDQKVFFRFECGGSLINERVILTAAHCAIKINERTAVVRAGERDANKEEQHPHQDRSIVKILNHPEYDDGTLQNDISLLVVSEPFKFAPNVNTICLPNKSETPSTGTCTVSGWGKDINRKSQSILKKTNLPIVTRDDCQSKLREVDELGSSFILHGSFMCAGGIQGEDTCQGDGGSPLVCQISGTNDRHQQVGIVSWGVGCGNTLPAVYVNVAHFTDWIEESMKNLSITHN